MPRRSLNQTLAIGVKMLTLQDQPIWTSRLRASTDLRVNPVRRYRGHSYFTYCDGRYERVVLSREEDVLFAPLLGSVPGQPCVEDDVFRVPLLGTRSDAVIEGARITDGGGGLRLEAGTTSEREATFDLGPAHTEVLVGGTLVLTIRFSYMGDKFEVTHRLSPTTRSDPSGERIGMEQSHRVRALVPLQRVRADLRRGIRSGRFAATRAIVRIAVRSLGYERYEAGLHTLRRPFRRPSPYRRYAALVDSSQAEPGVVLLIGASGTFTGSLVALASVWPHVRPGVHLHVAVKEPGRWRLTLTRYGITAELVRVASSRWYDLLRTAEVIVTDAPLPLYVIPTAGQTIAHLGGGTWQSGRPRGPAADLAGFAKAQRTLLVSHVLAESSAEAIDQAASTFMIERRDFTLMPSPQEDLVARGITTRNELRDMVGAVRDARLVLWMPCAQAEYGSARNAPRFEEAATFNGFAERVCNVATHPPSGPAGGGELIRLPPGVDPFELAGAADVVVTDDPMTARGLTQMGVAVAGSPGQLRELLAEGPRPTRGDGTMSSAPPPASGLRSHSFLNALEELLAERADAPRDEQQRVALYPGSLLTNGITSAFIGQLGALGDSRRYEVVMSLWRLAPNASRHVQGVLDSGHDVVVCPEGVVLAESERLLWRKLWWRLPLSRREWDALQVVLRREARRTLGRRRYDDVVHFPGYDALTAWVLSSTGARSHVFAHSDMGKELALRNNFNEQVLRWEYQRATTIPVVSEPLRQAMAEYLADPSLIAKLRVVHTTIDPDAVRRAAEDGCPHLDPNLQSSLDNPDETVFVNVGRFSPEKGQARLVEAFTRVATERAGSPMALVIIASHGSAREEVLDAVARSSASTHIHVLEDINPFPVLARCDLFVLASHYEGLPMVFLEALALGVPILSTDIPGPRDFLSAGYGTICPDSTDGLAQGMRDFLDGSSVPTPRHLDEHVAQTAREFEALFE